MQNADGLRAQFSRKTSSMGYNETSYMYRKLEVERKAWERYGGPEAF